MLLEMGVAQQVPQLKVSNECLSLGVTTTDRIDISEEQLGMRGLEAKKQV